MQNLRTDIPLLHSGDVHYLDNAATALMPQDVLSAVAEYDSLIRANVGRGVYGWAESATIAYDNARTTIANAINAQFEEIIFCGGATAALNIVAMAIADTLDNNDAIWLATDNHHSHCLPWYNAAKRSGATIHFLPTTTDGRINISQVTDALASIPQQPRVLAVSHAGNVSGALSPLSQLADIAAQVNALLIVDGAQYVPHALPDMQQCGADAYIFSGHKCYAPNGIGVLWARHQHLQTWQPPFAGGGMADVVTQQTQTHRPPPHGWEAGTPPISQAIGLAAAIQWMQQWPPQTANYIYDLCAQLKTQLAQLSNIKIYSDDNSTMVSFHVAGAHPHDICQLMADKNVAARGGHHCAQPLMQHLQISGCTRFSIAPYNTAADINAAAQAAATALDFLR